MEVSLNNVKGADDNSPLWPSVYSSACLVWLPPLMQRENACRMLAERCIAEWKKGSHEGVSKVQPMHEDKCPNASIFAKLVVKVVFVVAGFSSSSLTRSGVLCAVPHLRAVASHASHSLLALSCRDIRTYTSVQPSVTSGD